MRGSARVFAAMASLVPVFVCWTGSAADSAQTDSRSSDAASAALTLILRDYNTSASGQLEKLAADFNHQRAPGVPPIVYLDYDRIATWFGMDDGPATVESAIGDYLSAETRQRYDASTLAALASAMNNLDAEGVEARHSTSGNCVVVPQYPGISFHSAYGATFRLAQSDLLADKAIAIDLPTKTFADFVNAHESWHCLDIRYIRDSGDGLEGTVKRNRTEMFADIGGAMEAIRNGADVALIDKLTAVHATWAFVMGPALARTPADDGRHFDSIAYATEDGLLALRLEIERMGIANFRKLNREQLRALNYKITDAHCLSYEQAQALQTYFESGKAQAAGPTLIERLKTIAADSLRDATPEELAARAAQTQQGTEQSTATARDTRGADGARRSASEVRAAEQSMLQQMRARAGELGDADSFVDQLKARAELTDRLRIQLQSERDPASEHTTEAQLNLLFYVDPRLLPRQDRIHPAAFSDVLRPSHAQ